MKTSWAFRLLSVCSASACVSMANVDIEKRVDKKKDLEEALMEAAKSVQKEIKIFALKSGIPGMAATVSLCGMRRFLFSHGYSDVENLTPFSVFTVSRIASISKCFTAVVACKLLEKGTLSLSDPVSKYVKDYDGPAASCTIQQLLSHSSGLRSYSKETIKVDSKESTEMYVKTDFKNLAEAVGMFRNDALVHSPGTKYLYTTHGYTLISLILDKICQSVEKDFKELFESAGLSSTYIERNNDIIPSRSRQYEYGIHHTLNNVPYVNNTYKFAGGGLLSSSYDLNLFGEFLVKCYLGRQHDGNDYYIMPTTVKQMWTGVIKTDIKSIEYGLGWMIAEGNDSLPFHVFHTGGAIGGTSVLFIIPCTSCNCTDPCCGIVINVLCNLQSAKGIYQLSKTIARIFYPLFKTLCDSGMCHTISSV